MDVKDIRRSQYARGRLPTFQNKTRGGQRFLPITKTSIYEDRMHPMASYGSSSPPSFATDSVSPVDLFAKPVVRDAGSKRRGKDAARRRRHDLREIVVQDLKYSDEWGAKEGRKEFGLKAQKYMSRSECASFVCMSEYM